MACDRQIDRCQVITCTTLNICAKYVIQHKLKLVVCSGYHSSSCCWLQIWRINTKYNVLYLQGPATPGPPHCFTRIYDTGHMGRRLEMVSAPPMPTFYADDVKEPLPEEFFDKDLFQFTEPSIVYSIEDADKKKKIKKKT